MQNFLKNFRKNTKHTLEEITMDISERIFDSFPKEKPEIGPG